MIRTLVLAPLALVALISTAHAHFKLYEPMPDRDPDPMGKEAPCGDQAPATTAVSNYMPGQMITIRLAETVNHPGHYRVALAQDEAALPAEPPVTPGPTACGSAPIAANPTLPVLADGLFVNLTKADGVQMVQVQLPAGMTCTNCVLQVLEFMSDHTAPCFYHHCAKVTISANAPDAGPSSGGDGTSGPDAGTNPASGATGGCSTTRGNDGALSILGMLAVLFVIRRRRRR